MRVAPTTFLLAGIAIAIASIPAAAAAGAPFLSFDELNPWLVTYAVGLFAALFATPFAIHRGLGGLLEADARWERALIRWGGVSIGLAAVGLLCGLPSRFASDSLAASLGLVALVEAALVLATLLAWLLTD